MSTTELLRPKQSSPELMAKLLATLSLAMFWCVPISPLLSIAAIKSTEKTSGWPRFFARTGACLCIFWVGLMAAALAWILYIVAWNPGLA